jgi:hypothetical protein
MKKIITFAGTVIFLSVFASNAWSGFFTGSDYIKMADIEQLRYLAGAVDGIGYGLALADRDEAERFDKQVAGMELDEIKNIVNRFINEHPERWRYPMPELIYDAIKRSSK